MKFLTISCSLNPNSRSRVLARAAHARLESLGLASELVDLQEAPLPQCDGNGSYSHPAVLALQQRIAQADGVIIASPVYNYDVNSAAKNMVELTGDAWQEKVVAFLTVAGGRNSYMAVMGLANSLMLDFRAVIVPRFVHAHETDIEGDELVEPRLRERVDEVTTMLVRIARAVKV